MFYEVSSGHGLAYDPFKAIISPRPIGWISSISKEGAPNLAPYSFFNAVNDAPPIVMFASTGRKDSLRNIEETGEFAYNFVGENLLHEMSATSAMLPHGESEFEFAGLEMAACKMIKAPCVAAAYANLECKVVDIIHQKDLAGNALDSWVVFGQVVGTTIADAVLTDGRFDLTKARPASRLGYRDYAIIREIFELERPK